MGVSVMTHTLEKHTGTLGRARLHVKGFRDSRAMHKWLNTGSNGVAWCESKRGLKPGVYVWLGGSWINTKNLDPMTLAHV